MSVAILAVINAAVSWSRDNWRVLAVVAATLAVLGGFAFCRPRDTPLPPKDGFTRDSLAVTQPAFRAHVDTILRQETVFVQQSSVLAHAAALARAVADSIGKVADSIQRAAESEHDTASSWRRVALARGEEVTALHAANDSLERRAMDADSARILADGRANAEAQRRTALEDYSARLVRDVKSVGRCRVAFLFNCPSRTVAAAAGVALGVLATVELRR